MKHYIGIDAGGTKTKFVCFDEGGHPEKEATLPSCHILQVTPERAVEILREGIARVRPETGEACRICAGMAGYGKDVSMRRQIEEICEEAFGTDPYSIYSDAQIALSGALHGKDGILLIAGTGSIAQARCQGKYLRCGGWGYQLGDEGSSWWIGKQLLSAYTRQCDGRMQPTLLKEVIRQRYGLEDDYDLISSLNPDRTEIAALAKTGSDLVKKGDPAARKIYEEAAGCLAELVNTLVGNFEGPVPLALAGGLWKAGDFFREMFQRQLKPDILLQEDMGDPVYGAYLLAASTEQ